MSARLLVRLDPPGVFVIANNAAEEHRARAVVRVIEALLAALDGCDECTLHMPGEEIEPARGCRCREGVR